jgi:hypothetical protein
MPTAIMRQDPGEAPWALSDPAKEILTSVYLHRMLTTSQLRQLHGTTRSVQAMRKRLAWLAERGFISCAVGPLPGKEFRWYLTDRGAEMAELGGDVEIRTFRMSQDRAAGAHADHLIALNDVGIALTEAARVHGDSFDYRRWRHEVAHRYGRGTKEVLSADAVITYDVRSESGVTAERRFIEVDRDTESVHELAEKVHAYQLFFRWEPPRKDYETHLPKLGWRRSYHVFPGVVFVYAGISPKRARARTEDLANFLSLDRRVVSGSSTGADVAVTTLEALQSHGPFAQICRLLPTQEPVPLFRRR